MKNVGGNTKAIIQTHTTERNAIGENVKKWSDVQTLTGWLDLSGGGSNYTAYAAKVKESTDLFIANYVPLREGISEENSRLVVNGKVYDIMLIDDPMGLHAHYEIYLKYTGGG